MQVLFKQSFVKDFKVLPQEVKREVKKVCVEVFPKIKSLQELSQYDVKQLNGFKNYYRIKLGNYRIGFKKENNAITFMRVLDRKDIYRHFP